MNKPREKWLMTKPREEFKKAKHAEALQTYGFPKGPECYHFYLGSDYGYAYRQKEIDQKDKVIARLKEAIKFCNCEITESNRGSRLCHECWRCIALEDVEKLEAGDE